MRYKHLIFDFDGVLVDSNEIRFQGFRFIFKDYPAREVDRLIEFCRVNSGLPRYVKIQYFFERIRGKAISSRELKLWGGRYSRFVKSRVIAAPYVRGALEFLVSSAPKDYDCVIISGSDEAELRQVCRCRRINSFFLEILGSPQGKEANLAGLFLRRGWPKRDALFIGDSLNDFEAARNCGIDFIARDSGLVDWGAVPGIVVIKDLTELALHLG